MATARTKWIAAAIGLSLILLALGWLRLRGAPPAAPGAPTAATAATAKRARAPDLHAEPRGGLEGRIVDPAGAPVPRAQVCAGVSGRGVSAAEMAEPTCVEAGADGRYKLTGQMPARYQLDASAPRYRPASYRSPAPARLGFVDLDAGRTQGGLDITLEPGGAAVRGHVKDISGGVVRDARVIVQAGGFRRGGLALARTDAAGLFTTWVAEGPVYARAVADGYAEGERYGAAPGPEIEILLTPESVLVGRVVAADTGEPVPGAKIALESAWGSPDRGGAPEAVCDDGGRFRIRRLSPGRYKPSATAPGRYGQARESVLLGLGQTSSEVVIEVHPAFDVAARVVVAPDGAACAEGSVELHDRARNDGREAALDRAGAVRFEGVLPGTYEVHVSCEARVAEPKYPPVVVTQADVEGLIWSVHEGLAIRGKVVDHDRKPVRARLRAAAKGGDPRAPRTDGWSASETDGTFAIKGLLAATYAVTAIVDEHPAPDPVEVQLDARGARDLEIVIDRGGDVEGTVADEDGHPVAGAEVSAQGPKMRWGDQQRTQADGSFTLRGLPPGDYRVVARRDGDTLRQPGKSDDDPAGVPAVVKASTTARVKLVVERKDGELPGRVVDDLGEPVTDAFIDAEREPEHAGAAPGSARRAVRWGWSRTPTLADLSGNFTIKGLAKGAYAVRAYRKGGGETFAEHAQLGRAVTLTFRPTSSLSGTVTVGGGGAVDRLTLRVSDRGTGLARSETFFRTGGAWTMRDLPAGKLEVSADAPEGAGTVEVVLGDGEAREGVTIALSGRTTLQGRVVSLADGAPVPGIRVSASAQKSAGWSSAPDDPEKGNITDAQGAFRIAGAPVGPILIALGPLDWRNSEYGWVQLPLEVAEGPMTDVGALQLPRRRVAGLERGGDLGFDLAEKVPGTAPTAVVFKVALVRPGGPAAAAGLAAGDVIVSVDGTPVTGPRTYLYATLTRVAEGTTVALGLERGAVVQVTAVKPP
jgi:protocatechuate 3,4-dioxygenase beta subunit